LSGGDLIKQPDGQQGLPQGSDIPVNQIPDLACQMARSRQLQTVRTPRAANRPTDTLEGLPGTGHRGGQHRTAPRRRAKAELELPASIWAWSLSMFTWPPEWPPLLFEAFELSS
jgi:hypothetical protein